MVKFLIAGHMGMLGSALMRQGKAMNLDIVGLGHDDMDITDEDEVRTMASAFSQRTVINAAGVVRAKASTQANFLMPLVNTKGPMLLSSYFDRVVQISTDCVFDGERPGGYRETDQTCPSDLYGQSKAAGELTDRPHLTIRGSFIGFGPDGFLDRMILSQEQGAQIFGYTDWSWNGLYVEVFAKIVLAMAQLPIHGIAHVSGEVVTKGTLVELLAAIFRPDLRVVQTMGGRKDMILRSNAFTFAQFEKMAGIPLSWGSMIRSMQDDYSNNPSRPIRSE